MGAQIESRRVIWAVMRVGVIAFFALLAAYMTWLSTSLYGPGLSPDSTGYIRLARDISDNGLAFLFRDEAVAQPPLYSMILAATSVLTGKPVMHAAALLNVMLAAALVLVILVTVSRITHSTPVLMVIGVLACFSVPLTAVWSMAWTEPLFILVAFLAMLTASGNRHPTFSPLLAGLLAAFAVMTRYAGIVLIPIMAGFLLLSGDGNVRQRLRHAAIYCIPVTATLVLYVVRNCILSGTAFGQRFPSQTGILENTSIVKDVVVGWFLPFRLRSWAPLLLLMAAVSGWFAWRRRYVVSLAVRSGRMVVLCAIFCVAYPAFMVWISSSKACDALDDRLLSPLYPPTLVLFAALLRPASWRIRWFWALFAGMFCVLLVVSPVRETCARITRNAERGAGGYNTRTWQESEMIGYFRKNGQPAGERLFSNATDVLYILADVEASVSPARVQYKSDEATGVTAQNLSIKYPGFDRALLAWFTGVHHEFLFTLQELDVMCDLELVKEFGDGAIFRIRGVGNQVMNGR